VVLRLDRHEPRRAKCRSAAVPVIESLSLKAVDGLSVARSQTLQFEAVGRRPAGTLATKVDRKQAVRRL
jgi:hypothetical protein